MENKKHLLEQEKEVGRIVMWEAQIQAATLIATWRGQREAGFAKAKTETTVPFRLSMQVKNIGWFNGSVHCINEDAGLQSGLAPIRMNNVDGLVTMGIGSKVQDVLSWLP